MTTETFYTVLGIPVTATPAEVTAAYERQRERYSPERVAALGTEFQHVATARTTNLERAYAALTDPRRRTAYDRSIGIAPPEDADDGAHRRRLSQRETLIVLGGALAALLVITTVWVLSGQRAQPGLPPVAEVKRPAPDCAA